MRALSGELQRDLAADAAAAADDEHDLPAEFLLRRHALKLRLFERPVLDAERLRAGQRDVVVERLELRVLLGPPRLPVGLGVAALVFERVGARHDVNGVDEELGRDARLALVLREPEQPEAGDQDDRRIRAAQRRRCRFGERLCSTPRSPSGTG